MDNTGHTLTASNVLPVLPFLIPYQVLFLHCQFKFEYWCNEIALACSLEKLVSPCDVPVNVFGQICGSFAYTCDNILRVISQNSRTFHEQEIVVKD